MFGFEAAYGIFLLLQCGRYLRNERWRKIGHSRSNNVREVLCSQFLDVVERQHGSIRNDGAGA